MRVNVQLINAANDSHIWADTLDRKLTDIFAVESEVAKSIADQLQVKLTGREEREIKAEPTSNPAAYDAYLRALSYTLQPGNTPAISLGAQKYLREAVRLDPKFALAWALLARVDAGGYITSTLQRTEALREEAREAADQALRLQPDLGEALLAKGYYYYGCLKDYDSALRSIQQARQLLPNSSELPEALAYIYRRRGDWDRSEGYFNEAERLDPRNVRALTQHALSFDALRRFPDASRKLDQVLQITPGDADALATKASIAQVTGDLTLAGSLLAKVVSTDNPTIVEAQVRQAILEGRPASIIPRLEQIVSKPNPKLGFFNAEIRFYLGWVQHLAGDAPAARENWQQTRSELDAFLKKQPEDAWVLADLALVNMALGENTAALNFAERGIAANPMERDAVVGPAQIEILARVAAQTGESDRAIGALEKVLATPYTGWTIVTPLTPAILRLDPMFDPLRKDPRFQKLIR